MPGAGQAMCGHLMDGVDVRFLGGVVGVVVVPLIHVRVVGLGVAEEVADHLVAIDHQVVAHQPTGELGEHLGVVVRTDAGIDPVVPAVQSAQEVVAFHGSIGEQRPPMKAASVEDRVRVAPSDDDQVDTFHLGACRFAVRDLAPGCDTDRGRFYRCSHRCSRHQRPRFSNSAGT